MGDIIIEETNHRAICYDIGKFLYACSLFSNICTYGFMKENKLYIIVGLLAAVYICCWLFSCYYTSLKEKNITYYIWME